MKTRTLFPILLISLMSCNDNWDTELYIQKIEGSTDVLYKYSAWGGRDSHVFGYMLQDSTEKFEVNSQKNLLFSYLTEVPNKNHIQGVAFEKPDLDTNKVKKYTPIKTLSNEIKNLSINTKLYQYSGFMERNGGLKEYEFEDFKETRDSLIFFNLERVNIVTDTSETLNSLRFQKKNVEIFNNAQPDIIRIVINDLRLNQTNDEIISNITYYLIPKREMNTNRFSDYGIFKQIR